MNYKQNGEWSNEDRDNRITDLLGFIWGMIPNDTYKSGFGSCNHCMFANIEAEKEKHPEGLGMVITGAHLQCEKKIQLNQFLMGSEFKTNKRCTSFVPKMCDLCQIAGFNEGKECRLCIWAEE